MNLHNVVSGKDQARQVVLGGCLVELIGGSLELALRQLLVGQLLQIVAQKFLYLHVRLEALRHKLHAPGKGVPELTRNDRNLLRRISLLFKKLRLVSFESGDESDVKLVEAAEDFHGVVDCCGRSAPTIVQLVDHEVVGQEDQVLGQARYLQKCLLVVAFDRLIDLEEIGVHDVLVEEDSHEAKQVVVLREFLSKLVTVRQVGDDCARLRQNAHQLTFRKLPNQSPVDLLRVDLAWIDNFEIARQQLHEDLLDFVVCV